MTFRAIVATTMVVGCGVGQALAQQPAEGFTLGLGVTHSTSIFVGENNETQALPLLRYEAEAFSIGIPDGLRVTLISNQQLQFSAVVSPRFSALDDTDSPALAGIDRDITVDGGVQLRYSFGHGTQLHLRALTELSDDHGGHEIAAEVRQPLPLGQTPLLLSAGLTWQSDDLARYSYGVFANEAAIGRPAYAPGNVIIPHIAVSTVFPINDRVNLVGSVRATFLPDDVSDSPIVDEDVGLSSFVGLSYRF
ncbi:MipA/OmpV family protein [uncultured Tateyamaria sp.]|uniref:MipA/OmpV family protein n=1 Tax=uncultured Tateyamaria sp. TaxID=455651 RepID=UPI0026060379|nr:MipA/OmpV family protein [uncultured Tateyamaria sp.]